MDTLTKNEGLITKIIGPVIDVEFQQGELPEIYTALHIHISAFLASCASFINVSECASLSHKNRI